MSTPSGDPASRRAAAAAAPPADPFTPADRYQELFVAVQQGLVFDDSKAFVDCAPRDAPAQILTAFRAECELPAFDLRAFVGTHFAAPVVPRSEYTSRPGQGLAEHIDSLWPVLSRQPDAHPRWSSLLPLPHPYVVPGGRFSELYYWDSYFTMLGLADGGCGPLLHAMTDNFAYLIDTFGRVPNGTRSYYLSRSQPPVFALMTRLCESRGGQPALEYLPQLRREHAFWMDGADLLAPGEARRRVVALPDGRVLNRYWDDRQTPREESWREDVATASRSGRPAGEVFRDLRAAAESGWDFSSRWFAEPHEQASPAQLLASTRTTRLLPVDLNAFLHFLERTISQLSGQAGDATAAQAYALQARQRRATMDDLFWDPVQGAYFDFDWSTMRRRTALTAAAVVPLFTGSASPAQALQMAAVMRSRLLAPGGLATTEWESGQQWDRPNGWAPLQWMAVEGLAAYGQGNLAGEIRSRWMKTVSALYRREGRLVEKYALRERDPEQAEGGGGGEYPLQDGFGWTNGVTRRWLAVGSTT